MSLEKMEALEVRRQEELSQDWEQERSTIRTRIEKVLGELDFLERSDSELQGATHAEDH